MVVPEQNQYDNSTFLDFLFQVYLADEYIMSCSRNMLSLTIESPCKLAMSMNLASNTAKEFQPAQNVHINAAHKPNDGAMLGVLIFWPDHMTLSGREKSLMGRSPNGLMEIIQYKYINLDQQYVFATESKAHRLSM